MDLKALNEWTETPEGESWLNEKKQGVLSKNTELLQALKTANGGLSETSQRLADTEKALEIEKAELKRVLLDTPLDKMLKDYGCFEILIPQIIREIKETYGLSINGNAGDLKVTGTVKKEDGTESQMPMGDIVDSFLKTETGRQYVNPANLKTEVISTTLDVKGGSKPTDSLTGKTGQELAKMTDQEFQDAIQQSMR